MIREAVRSNPHGWVVVAVCFMALCLVYAARSSLGLMIPAWEADPGWPRDFTATGGAIVLLLMAVASPFVGDLVDRAGPRHVCAAGLLLAGLGILLTSQSTSQRQFVVYFGLLLGAGSGAVAMPMVAAATARHFTANRGIANGIALSGATGGQLLALPVLGVLVTEIGWRSTYTIWCVGLFAFGVTAWLVLRDRAPEPDPAARAGAPPDALRRRLGVLARSTTFWLLAAGFFICGFTTAGVIEVHFLPYAASCGFLPVEGATAYGVHGGFNMIGVILSGLLTDRMHQARLLASMYFVRVGLFVLLMFVAGHIELLFVFAALFGLFNFATMPPIASIVASHIGIRFVGLAMGLIFAGHWLGAALGAWLGGVFYGAFARYDEVWIAALLLALLAGFLSLCIPERGRARREPAAAAAA